MKIDSVIILILVFGVVTILVAGVIGDMNNNYNINASTEFQNQYNFADNINASVSAIATDAQEAGKESGWLSVLSGANAIWRGVSTTVTLILGIPFYTTSIIRGIGAEMGVPPAIIYIFLVIILVSLVFMTVRFIRGENV